VRSDVTGTAGDQDSHVNETRYLGVIHELSPLRHMALCFVI